MNQYIVGHRGAAGLAAENTLKAFRIGCESSAQVVECDIHLSRDKELVVIHDNILDRTTNGKGWVKDFTSAQLTKLDAGGGEKIPTLQEVVNLVSDYNKMLIIEIKGESWEIAEATAQALLAFIKRNRLKSKQVIVHSFWHRAVFQFKKAAPKIKTAVIMMLGLPAKSVLDLILAANADGASIAYDYISQELIDLTREKKLFLDAWLLNDQQTFARMKNMGVNGLITNFPGKFL